MFKRTAVVAFQKYILNPVSKPFAGRAGNTVLLETNGRRTGEPRRTPVGANIDGNTLWIVAEQGTHANYVRNIKADPHVRVKVGGRWKSGVAHILPDDDAKARTRGSLNGFMVRLVGTELLTVRIALD